MPGVEGRRESPNNWDKTRHLLPHQAWLLFHGEAPEDPEMEVHAASCLECAKLLLSCVGKETFGEYLKTAGYNPGEVTAIIERCRPKSTK